VSEEEFRLELFIDDFSSKGMDWVVVAMDSEVGDMSWVSYRCDYLGPSIVMDEIKFQASTFKRI
jgi:hypothetical protein